MKKTFFKSAVLSAALIASVTSCKKDDNKEDGGSSPATPTQTTYEFTREGETSVSYSGQTTRLAMLSEIVSYVKGQISDEAVIDAVKVKAMYAGTGFENTELDASGKQLKKKTYASEVDFFETAIDSLAANSLNYGPASNGVSGVISNNDESKKYLVDANGVEWIQVLEKGLMGAVFYYQSTGTQIGYLDKIVNGGISGEIIDGKNYTEMEHFFDEAFGYFGVSIDFPATIPSSFWGKYSDKQNVAYGSNSIMTNFINARQAIVSNNIASRDENIKLIKEKWEKISAAQAFTYLNDFKTKINNGDKTAYHSLAEAYTFVYNLQFSNIDTRKLTSTEVITLLDLLKENSKINFYYLNITDDVDVVINTLKSAYNL